MSKWHLRIVAILLSVSLVGSACLPAEAAFRARIDLRSSGTEFKIISQQAVMPPLGSFPDNAPDPDAVRLFKLETAASKPPFTLEDARKAITELRSSPSGSVFGHLMAEYGIVEPLNLYQEALDAMNKAILSLKQPIVLLEGLYRRFELLGAYCVRALTWNKLADAPKALADVTAATTLLNGIDTAAKLKHRMEWNAALNTIHLAHGQALYRRWEQTKSGHADLRTALGLLTKAVAGFSTAPEKYVPLTIRALAHCALGWVQFNLEDFGSAADTAVQALALNPQNPDARRLGETIQQAIHMEVQRLTQQQAKFIELEVALKANDEGAASDALDKLVALKWPQPQVVYYRGLLAFNSGDYARASEIWSGASMNDLIAIGDTEGEKSEIQRCLVKTQLRIGKIREAIVMAQPLIQRNSPDAVLAQILVDALPEDPNSYSIVTEALAGLQLNSQVKAFVHELENVLGQKQPAPLWVKEVRTSLHNLVSAQRPVKDKWDTYTQTQKSNSEVLKKFFTQKPWDLLSSEDKARLLLSWANAFLTIGKFRERQPAVVLFITEARKVVEASMEKKDSLIPEDVLTSLRETLVTGLPAMLKTKLMITLDTYEQSVTAVTALNRQILSALSFYQARREARALADSLERSKRERDQRMHALMERWNSLADYIVKLDPITQRDAILEAQTQRAVLFAESSEFPENRVGWAARVDKWLSEAEDHYEKHESGQAAELVSPWEENARHMQENIVSWDRQWHIEKYVQFGEALAANQASHPLARRPEVLDAQGQFWTAVRRTKERTEAHEKFTFDKWQRDEASIIETLESYGKELDFWTEYLRILDYDAPLIDAFLAAIEADVPARLIYMMISWLMSYKNYRVQAALVSLEPVAESRALAAAMIEKLAHILQTDDYWNEPARDRLVTYAA